MPTIALEKVSKFYKREGRWESAVREVSLTIEQGEFVFLIGSSGAGKSTLLKLITNNIRPDRGRIFVGAREISRTPPWNRSRVALMFGQVWQEQSLMRKRTVRENLAIAARIGINARDDPMDGLNARIRKVLGLVGMQGVEDKYPVELSIGECRRVELARALINSPPILVLDEITANLDGDNIWDMFQLLNDINRKGTTVIMATHASQYVNIMRRRVVTLVDGRIFGDVKKGKYGDVV